MEIKRIFSGGHSAKVTAVCLNAHRREVYSGGQDSTVKVWDSETGSILYTIREHHGWITGLLYVPEIRFVFSSSVDGRILAWDPVTRSVFQEEKLGSPIFCIAWDRRKRQIIAGINNGIYIFPLKEANAQMHKAPIIEPVPRWEQRHPSFKLVDDKRQIQRIIAAEQKDETSRRHLILHDGIIKGVVCSDGKIFVAGFDDSLAVCDSEKPQRFTRHSETHSSAISVLTFDSDNNWLVTGSFDKSVRVWSADIKMLQKFDLFPETITAACYVPTQKLLWVSSGSQLVMLDPRTGARVTEFVPFVLPPRFRGFTKMQWVPETNEMFAITPDKEVVVWKHNPNAAVAVLAGHTDAIEALAVKAGDHSTVIFSASQDGTIKKWEPLQLNTYMYSVETLRAPKASVMVFVYETDQVVIGTDGGKLIVHCLDMSGMDGLRARQSSPTRMLGNMSEQTLTEIETKNPGRYIELQLREAKKGGGDIIAERSNEKRIRKLEAAGQLGPSVAELVADQFEFTLGHHDDYIAGLASADHQLISVSSNGNVKIWDMHTRVMTGEIPAEQRIHDDTVWGVEYSPDLGKFATFSADKRVNIFDLSTLQFEMALIGHSSDVTDCKWSALRKTWVTASNDQTVRVWNPEGEIVQTLTSKNQVPMVLCIDQTYGYILAACADRAIRIYNPDDGQLLTVRKGHEDIIRVIVHVPDRRQYFSASWDGTVRVWHAYEPDFERKSLARSVPIAARAMLGSGEEEQEAEDPLVGDYARKNPLTVPRTLQISTFSFFRGLEGSMVAEKTRPKREKPTGKKPPRERPGKEKSAAARLSSALDNLGTRLERDANPDGARGPSGEIRSLRKAAASFRRSRRTDLNLKKG